MQHVAVGKTCQSVMFGEISDAFGLALANRDIAQDRSVLEAFRSLPAREARFDGKCLAVLATPLELHDNGPAGHQQRLARSIAHGKRLCAPVRRYGAEGFERTSD